MLGIKVKLKNALDFGHFLYLINQHLSFSYCTTIQMWTYEPEITAVKRFTTTLLLIW